MQMVKISFPDAESCTRGSYELMKRVRMTSLPDDEFIVSEDSLTILDECGIPYRVIERCALDHALKALRDSAAAPI